MIKNVSYTLFFIVGMVRIVQDAEKCQSTKLCSTQAFTLFSYSLLLSLYNWAAIELAGELGFGSLSKDWNKHIFRIKYVTTKLDNIALKYNLTSFYILFTSPGGLMTSIDLYYIRSTYTDTVII